MRYIKLLLAVLLFFIVMLLFVQNQASFSDPVTIKFDPLVFPAMSSMPLPRYTLLLLAFLLGALVVLVMSVFDLISTKLSRNFARKQVKRLQAKIVNLTSEQENLQNSLDKLKEEKEKLQQMNDTSIA